MAAIESELGTALNTAVRRKSNNTQKLRSKAKRTASGSSEVMLKVTGFGKGAGHVKAHMDYITRNGKLEMENDQGEVFNGKEEVKSLFKDWEKDFGDGKRHKEQRDTMHMMLSMPASTNPEAVRNAVREFAKETFSKNHEYVFALHTDQAHPHCHVTVKCLGFDGTRLNPRKADLQEWREKFAEKMREQGADAEATPRRSRGVVRKAEPNVIRHIERGDKTHAPRISKVTALKIKEAALEITAEAKGLPVAQKPWERSVIEQQKEVRRAWLAAADALEREDARKTFNQKENHNGRPDYKRINPDRTREGQRGAALYQSNIGESGRKTPPEPVTRLRNMPRVDLVPVERGPKVLLHTNALDNLGGERSADSGMRRAGVGAYRASGSERRIAGHSPTEKENKELAGRIRGFVGAMPVIETESQRIKSDLTKRFTKQAEVVAVTKAEIATNKGVIQVAPKQERDIER